MQDLHTPKASTTPAIPLKTLVSRESDKFTEYPFEINKAIIAHFIYNQGSNIQKALMELVMNAIDAQATNISLTIHKDHFICEDNGVGFKTRTEIEDHFRTFGTPHLEGDAKYGRFRLGRGQIMAFAHTIWQSHNWLMNVKIRNQKEPSFGLSTTDHLHTQPYDGCKITGIWEKPLDEWQVTKIINNLRVMMKFIPVPITLNHERLGFDVSARNFKWSHEDENAYYYIAEERPQTLQMAAPLQIFNMGIFVTEYPKYRFGISGIILTKKAIKLNTSRTSIMSDQCPVWEKIETEINRISEARKKKSKIWDLETKAHAMQQILDHHPKAFELFVTAPLITVVGSSKAISINKLFSDLEKPEFHGITICQDKKSLPNAEIIAKNKNISVIHPNITQLFQDIDDTADPYITLLAILTDILSDSARLRQKADEAEYDPENAYTRHVLLHKTRWLTRITPQNIIERAQRLDFKTISDNLNLNDEARIVSPSKALSKDERRVWFSFKKNLISYIEKLLRDYIPTKKDVWPTVVLGDSTLSLAWTDGATYIAFSKQLIKKISKNPCLYGEEIFNIATHETIHFGASTPSQNIEHDLEFYKIFHDITMQSTALRNTHLRKALSSYRYRLHEELRHLIYPDPWHQRDKNEQRKKKTRGLIHGRIAYHYDILAMRLALSDTYQFTPDRHEDVDADDLTSLLSGSLPDNERTSKESDIEKILSEKLSSLKNPEKTEDEKERETEAIKSNLAKTLLNKTKETIISRLKQRICDKMLSDRKLFAKYIKLKNPKNYYSNKITLQSVQEAPDPLSFATSDPTLLRETRRMIEREIIWNTTGSIYHDADKYCAFTQSLIHRLKKTISTLLDHTRLSGFPSLGDIERWIQSILNCLSLTDLTNEFIQAMLCEDETNDPTPYLDPQADRDYTHFSGD